MKIALAQTKPYSGDINRNIQMHLHICQKAIEHGADLIIFPELSITGYEPTLAKELAISLNDVRLAPFQKLSNDSGAVIGIGAPTKAQKGICITLILFQPGQPRTDYSKKYLHPDEEPYFVPGQNLPFIEIDNTRIGLAICYELSVPEHAAAAAKNGATLYLASVAKHKRGVNEASQRLSEISRTYHLPTLMCNTVGINDGDLCAGKSAIWDVNGEIIIQANDEQSLIFFDTVTGKGQSVDNLT